MKCVARGHYLPCQPARAEGLVAGEHPRQVTGLTVTAPIIIGYGLSDSFHFSLVTVSTCMDKENNNNDDNNNDDNNNNDDRLDSVSTRMIEMMMS